MSIDREPIQITASVDLEDLAEQLGGLDRDELFSFINEIDAQVAEADFTKRLAAHFVAEVANEDLGTAEMRHPMQPIVMVGEVVRFQENPIIRWMLDQGRLGRAFDLNTVACQGFADADLMQLAQLIGYSVSGYGDLSYASRSSVRKADEIVEAVLAAQKEKRIR